MEQILVVGVARRVEGLIGVVSISTSATMMVAKNVLEAYPLATVHPTTAAVLVIRILLCIICAELGFELKGGLQLVL